VDRDPRALLLHFGPHRKSQHPEYPFWRLQNDGLWELHGADLVKPRASNNDAKRSELLKHHVEGGLPESIFAALRARSRLLAAVAQRLLDANFPASMHEDILSAVGLHHTPP
jgi:putative restriction endonuclease